jgi:membrane protein required for colicin V production
MISNWIDIGILAILGISTLLGLFTGFIKGAISLISWILAFFLASYFYPDLAAQFQGLGGGVTANVLAYGIIFGGVIALGLITGLILTRIVFLSMTLTLMNSLFGGIFGLLRGGIFVVALTYIALLTPAPQYPLWRSATFIPFFASLADSVNGFIPDNIKQGASQLSPQNLKNLDMDGVKSQAKQYIQSYTNGGSQLNK